MLEITQSELASLAGISTTALNNIERGSADPKASTLKAIRAALEAAGVIFVEENGEGPGVRLKKRSETVADLTGQIDALKADMTPEPDNEKPSPKRGMKQLRRAHDLNELVDLKNRRAKVRKEEKE